MYAHCDLFVLQHMKFKVPNWGCAVLYTVPDQNNNKLNTQDALLGYFVLFRIEV